MPLGVSKTDFAAIISYCLPLFTHILHLDGNAAKLGDVIEVHAANVSENGQKNTEINYFFPEIIISLFMNRFMNLLHLFFYDLYLLRTNFLVQSYQVHCLERRNNCIYKKLF